MPRTAADNLAQYKYNKEHLKRIPLDVQRSDYARIKAASDAAGLPVNTWIKSLMFAALDASGAPAQDDGGGASGGPSEG